MKYVVIQGDGMADHPLDELSGRTPLEAANTPNMDDIASSGELGTVNTIPSSLPPGSSVGNMSLMGLDPEKYFTGRASLEARGMGVELREEDIVFRCNLVNLREAGEKSIMADYSGGRPPTEESKPYVNLLDEEMGENGFKFYSGVSYRNLLVWKDGRREVNLDDISLTPPHDITGESIEKHLPRGDGAQKLGTIQKKAGKVLGEKEKSFNAVWLWGAGVKPELPSFQERYGLDGVVISAVDLIKGLGAYAGLSPVEVEGATGTIDTNYEGKVDSVKENLKEGSIVFLHIEAPDEASHAGDLELKMESIERIDSRVVGPLFNYLSDNAESRLLLVTDHITGLNSKTHERGPVPFAVTGFAGEKVSPWRQFSEREASRANKKLGDGDDLFEFFINYK